MNRHAPHLVTFDPRPNARCRLFMFHHAGGSYSIFRGLSAALPDSIEARMVCYPERMALHRAPLPDDMLGLSRLLTEQISPLLDKPFALFGHSMGGQVAYQIMLDLLARRARQPIWLGVSAFEAPSRARKRCRERSLHLYSDDALRQHLEALGAMPAAILEEAAWRQFSTLIRKDLRLFERWTFEPASPTLATPLTAFVGDRDPLVGAAGCGLWAYFTHRWQGLKVLCGDHFYFLDQPAQTARHIETAITDALEGEPWRATA